MGCTWLCAPACGNVTRASALRDGDLAEEIDERLWRRLRANSAQVRACEHDRPPPSRPHKADVCCLERLFALRAQWTIWAEAKVPSRWETKIFLTAGCRPMRAADHRESLRHDQSIQCTIPDAQPPTEVAIRAGPCSPLLGQRSRSARQLRRRLSHAKDRKARLGQCAGMSPERQALSAGRSRNPSRRGPGDRRGHGLHLARS